jgi:sugar-specific transcriptional regulator TrmB
MSKLDLFAFLGATDKESATYLKLLALGAQPVSVIARHMNLPRSSMYSIVEHMKEIGLLAEFQRSGILYVQATASADLPKIIKRQQKHLEHGLQLIEEKMTELSSIENTLSITPTVVFFEGKKAVMSMYEDILSEKSFCSFFNPKLVKKLMPEYHFKIGDTIREKQLTVRELLVQCDEAIEYQSKYQSSLHKIHILPEHIRFASDTVMTRDKIFMISYGETDLVGTMIANASLSQTQMTLFETLWGTVS